MSVAASAYARSSFSCATLRDLRAGRQPQLVAGDVRPGDRADHLRLHAEVAQRLHQARRGALLPGGVRAGLLAGRARQQLAGVRQLPHEVGVVGRRVAQPALRRQRRPDRRPGHAGDRSSSTSVPAGSGHRRLGRSSSSARRALSGGCASPDARLVLRAPVVLRWRLDVRGAHDQLFGGGLGGRDTSRPRRRGASSSAVARTRLLASWRGALERQRCATCRRRVEQAAAGRPDRTLRRARPRSAGSRRRAAGTPRGCPRPRSARAGARPGRAPRRRRRRAPAERPRSTSASPRCLRPELTPSVPAASASVTAANRQIAPARSGPQRGQHRAQQQRAAARDERDRREHPRAARAPAERDRQPVPGAARRSSRRTARSP